MANLDELQKRHEARLEAVIQELAGGGQESDLALARALVHKGVHLAADRRAGEFCAVATFLCEMVGHAHGLMHPGDSGSGKHN
jgi:ABC-type ATPase involved in cell division